MTAPSWSASLCLLCACASATTTIEQSWRAPSETRPRPRNVVTLYNSPDGAIRRTLEDQMAYKLRRMGVAATPSYALNVTVQDRETTRAKLGALGFDAVVATRTLRKPDPRWPAPSDDYLGAAWPTTTDSPYVYTDAVVRLETAVYSLEDGKLLWTALSKTVDPAGAPRVIDEVTSLVAHELDRQGVFVATLTRLPR